LQNEQDQRRWRLVGLVERYFGRDYDLVARIIEEKTGGKVSERTVQAWLIAPGRKSSRNCPEWAVKALEEHVNDPANGESLQLYAARREATLSAVKAPLAWSYEVRSSRAVELATASLECEDRKLRFWQDAIGGQVGKMLFELERRLDAEMNAHRKTLLAIHEAFRTSLTYEECKSTFEDHVRAAELQDFFVREAKRAIENSTDEFSTPDAVIQQPRSEGT
jgi:hypothetical protein